MTALPRPTRAEGCLSDLKIDRLLAGELDPGTEREARAHAEGCARCAARLAAIEADRAAFLADPPPLPARPSANDGGQGRPSAKILRWAPRIAAPLAVAAAIAVWLVARPGAGPGDEPGTRIKGRPRIGFYVKRAGVVMPGAPGDAVQPGDGIQFTYSSDRPRHLAILSVDGARKASVYYPAGPRAVRVEPGRDQALDSSVVLDDVLGAETAYGLFCADPVELEPLRAAFEASPDRPPIPPSCEVDPVPFVKRPAR